MGGCLLSPQLPVKASGLSHNIHVYHFLALFLIIKFKLACHGGELHVLIQQVYVLCLCKLYI